MPVNEKCGIHDEAISNLKESDSKQWENMSKLQDHIDRLRNRPPVWCTVLISILMFALGWTLNLKKFASNETKAATKTMNVAIDPR